MLYIAKGDGSEPRQLAVLPAPMSAITVSGIGGFSAAAYNPTPAWSPDASHISLTVADPKTLVTHLWEISADGKDVHPMFPAWHARTGECCGRWTPDGKYFVFQSEDQIWAAREGGNLLRKVTFAPTALTVGTTPYYRPMPSKDGKELFAVAGFARGELQRYDARVRAFLSYFGGISAQDLTYSKDGKRVAYVSFPEGALWCSRNDGSERLQLTYPPSYALNPRWSPDGKQIAFFSMPPGGGATRIYSVSPEGGTPRELMPNVPGPQVDPNWSPDGRAMMFSGGALGPTAIHIFNMSTHQVTTIPNSQGLFSPRWSADGRYIVAMTAPAMKSLMLFNFETGKWSVLFQSDMMLGQPLWSRDGQYVYFWGGGLRSAVMRVAIPSLKMEDVVSLTTFHMTGHWGGYFGLAPDDSPLVLRDTGTQEIISLQFHEP